MVETIEIEFPRDPRIQDLLESLAGKLVNEWIGKSNYTTNAAVRAVRNTVGFHLFLELILDREDDLLAIMPRYYRADPPVYGANYFNHAH